MKNGTLMSRAVISHDNEKLRTAGVGGAEKGHIKVCSSFGSGLLSQSAVQSLWACLIARKNPAIPEDSKLQRKPKSNSRRVSTPFKSFFFLHLRVVWTPENEWSQDVDLLRRI